ncbi:endonuclease III [Lactobacillus ultunensis]|uniref:Endonuclease III n=1 Tax=Lactobacillus ultunensis DSM 16047 TaxID=525365 RepID=C2EK42_9LACO|nr:endonuclease III [Lactobacillus ultunensis]EEJ73057.1 putative endonuclease III [Lactobacillus ultunensis DSM 16047]KRL82674.1 DNA-(apurinic or apyrimidinic site) lyase [Lactobacillus ultunensis DSM 16047]QQP29424.1 endonuclease III [Lactobacillus ultunensis]
MSEKLLSDKEARNVLQKILTLYPNAKSELKWDSKFHLLCAVMMSAQTTDKMVNRVMPKFSQEFPYPKDLANAPIEQIENEIKTIGLYRSKAKHLKATAKILVDKYNSQIPKDKKILMTLPGVGEKTANVVLAEGYGVPAIAVDTHVSRISKKFHIVDQKATPHEVEKRLEAILPKEEWIKTHHAMIWFGRYTMPSRAKGDPYSYLNSQK